MAIVTVVRDLTLPVPPDRVWAEIVDPATWAEWNVNHVAFSGDVPPLSAGAEFTEQLQVRRSPAEVAWTVTELTAPGRLVLDGKGPLSMKVQHAFTVEPADGGSRVEVSLTLSAVALRPMAKPLTRELERNLPETLERLRGRLTPELAPS